jgi:F-type H+-transporting ATPase subunit a
MQNSFKFMQNSFKIMPFIETNSPLDQFEIRDLVSLDAPLLGDLHISLTNIGLYLIIAGGTSLILNILSCNYDKLSSNNVSIVQESVYATVQSIVINQINKEKGQIYFPFIYGLFIFILINNLIGMIPYSFASTSHFILTFSLSFTIVLGATFLGFKIHKLEFFSLFVPAGCPLGLLPLLVLIEFISYLARNVSLGLRLAANVLSGHMLLNILSGFTYNIMSSGILFFLLGLLPLSFIIAFSGLELGIAFIQAQVFVVLSCSYIKDALELH